VKEPVGREERTPILRISKIAGQALVNKKLYFQLLSGCA